MKTNSLKYSTSKVVNGKNVIVKIRLDDEFKNGHQDFSVTADVYEAGKPKTDKYMIGWGWMHDDVLEAFPEFKIFVDLHLCDYLGNPMYATANGFYHLKNGFNNTPVSSEAFVAKFCEYYRVSAKEFEALNTTQTQIQYAMKLIELGIPAKWKLQADKAIKYLEQLTGDEFIIDSTKDQFGMPTAEALAEEKSKIENGYYSEGETKKRFEADKQDFIKKLEADADKKIEEIKLERDVKIMMFELGGKRLIDNCIYYNHNNSLGFNWRSFGEKIEEAEAKQVFEAIQSKYPIKSYTMK
jgi:hypothetical protein